MEELNHVEQRIAEIYIAYTEQCSECRGFCAGKGLQQNGPLSFFNVGKDFDHDKHKVVFVGKNHWYDSFQVAKLESFGASGFKDCRDEGTEMFLTYSTPYWWFLRNAAKRLYPSIGNVAELLDHIAISNLTKCNTSSDYRNTTPRFFTDNCVKIFEEEMKALRPRHVIFLTGRSYDTHLESLRFEEALTSEDRTQRTERQELSKRDSVWWWDREFFKGSKAEMHFLRTRHPQGAPSRDQFIDRIAEWVGKHSV